MGVKTLNLQPFQDKIYDCFQIQVVNIAKWWEREEVLSFPYSWGFHLLPSTTTEYETFGQRLTTGWAGDFTEFEKYLGIDVEMHDTESLNDIALIVKKEMGKGTPVLVSFDSYWCPWGQGYQKYHVDHNFLIIGIDEIEQMLYCLDPFWTCDVQRISYFDFSLSCGKCYTFSMNATQQPEVFWGEVVNRSVFLMSEETNGLNMFKSIREFAHEIALKGIDYEKEMHGYKEVYMMPLFQKLYRIESGRTKFSRMLCYFAEKQNVKQLSELAYEVRCIANTWSKVMLALGKIYLMTNRSKSLLQVSEKLIQLADYEERTVKALNRLGQSTFQENQTFWRR